MFAPYPKGVVVTEKTVFPRRLFFEALPEFFERWPGIFRAAGLHQGVVLTPASSSGACKEERRFFQLRRFEVYRKAGITAPCTKICGMLVSGQGRLSLMLFSRSPDDVFFSASAPGEKLTLRGRQKREQASCKNEAGDGEHKGTFSRPMLKVRRAAFLFFLLLLLLFHPSS